MIYQLGLIGYVFCGVVFLLLSILMLTSWRGRFRTNLLMIASTVTAIWCIFLAFRWGADSNWMGDFSPIYFLELVRSGAWLLFTAVLLRDLRGLNTRSALHKYALPGVVSVLIIAAAMGVANRIGLVPMVSTGWLVISLVAINSLGLLMLEQIYRNSYQSSKRVLKFLIVGVGVMMAYDMFLYASSVIHREISSLYWDLRGFVFILCAPFVAVAAKRLPELSTGMFVSRQMVFYSATLVGAGIYLVVLAAVSQLLQTTGSSWGNAAQVAFLVAGIVLVIFLTISDDRRARFRVFIDKHFFQNKYDYRHEWLNLVRTLTSDDIDIPLRVRCISALGDIVGSKSGAMWVRDRHGVSFVPSAVWNESPKSLSYSVESSLISFLQDQQWVIDIGEYESNRDHYSPLEMTVAGFGVKNAGFVIPLVHHSTLLAVVVLSESSSRRILNYEDHDLLKTSGLQIASYLSQELLTEELALVRQFEAFNKLTAFLMHDLKNVQAQLLLVLNNAEKHKSNPVFVDDVLSTIDNSVSRLRRVLDQLAQGRADLAPVRVDIHKALLEATSAKADRVPAVHINQVDHAKVLIDRDKFLMVLSHLIGNAQEATASDGQINIDANIDDGHCVVSIADNGTGMDDAFVRNRLFVPFDSTKGSQGMGIGAYQARELIRDSGGYLDVESEIGVGTTVRITLPLAE